MVLMARGGRRLRLPPTVLVELLMAAGSTIKKLDIFYEKDAMRFATADSLGSAHSP